VRFKVKEDFKKPYAWDLGKRFRRVCKLAGIADLRIHDLRHFATTVLFIDEIPDAMIAKMTAQKRGTSEVSTSESRVQKADSRKNSSETHRHAYWHSVCF
jgi:integrase